jgi:hypothetical protein
MLLCARVAIWMIFLGVNGLIDLHTIPAWACLGLLHQAIQIHKVQEFIAIVAIHREI